MSKRNVTIIINGKEVEGTLENIRKAKAKINRELKGMQVGSDKYNKKLRELKPLEKQLKSHRKNLNDIRGAQKGIVSGLGNWKGLMLSTFAAGGVMSLMREGLQVFKEYEQAQADLAAVMRTTREENVLLEAQAQKLGATTAFTASEVVGLQKEYAKLGFTQNEILNSTEATLALSAATGKELSESAAIAGITVRQFGLDAAETGRVVDVMAKSFSTTALDIDKYQESMKYVGPAAKAAGVDLEETTALLGQLANAGISGSQAGTALRRILNEMAKTGQPAQEALKQVAAQGISLADAQDLVGRNAQTALLVLGEQADGLEGLTQSFRDAGGAAQEMAEKQLDTLTGDITKLTSAWEGFILSVEDGTGPLNKALRASMQMVTDVIQGLTQLSNYGGIIGKEAELEIQRQAQADFVRYQEVFNEKLAEGSITLDEINTKFQSGIQKNKEQLESNSDLSAEMVATLQARINTQQQVLAYFNEAAEREKIAAKEAVEAQLQKNEEMAKLEAQRIEKATQAEQKLNETIAQLKEQAHLASLSDDERELARIDLKYQKLKEKAIGNKAQMDELEALWAEERALKEAEQAEKKANEEQLLKEQKQAFQDELFQMTLDDFEREFIATNKKYEDLYQRAYQYGIDTAELQKQHQKELEELTAKHNKKQEEQSLANRERLQKIQQQKLNESVDTLESFGSEFASILQGTGAEVSGFTKHLKLLTNIQMVIDQAAAISSAVKNSAAGSLDPISFGVRIAAFTAAIAGAIGTARNMYSSSGNVPDGYYGGGFTGPGTKAVDHTGHSPVGVVHANEWVAPQWMTQSPMYANVLGALEAARSGRVGFYANGGGEVNFPAMQQSNAVFKELSASLKMLNTTLSKPIMAVYDQDEVLRIREISDEIEEVITQSTT